MATKEIFSSTIQDCHSLPTPGTLKPFAVSPIITTRLCNRDILSNIFPFRNRKAKHRMASGQYPLAKLIWVDWNRQADITIIELSSRSKRPFSHQPQGGVCHNDNLTRSLYNKGNESATDFAYALALYRREFTRTEIYNRIIEERQDWSNNAGSQKRTQYLNRTLLKAEEIIG